MCELKGQYKHCCCFIYVKKEEKRGGGGVYIYLQVTGKATGDVVTKHTPVDCH